MVLLTDRSQAGEHASNGECYIKHSYMPPPRGDSNCHRHANKGYCNEEISVDPVNDGSQEQGSKQVTSEIAGEEKSR